MYFFSAKRSRLADIIVSPLLMTRRSRRHAVQSTLSTKQIQTVDHYIRLMRPVSGLVEKYYSEAFAFFPLMLNFVVRWQTEDVATYTELLGAMPPQEFLRELYGFVSLLLDSDENELTAENPDPATGSDPWINQVIPGENGNNGGADGKQMIQHILRSGLDQKDQLFLIDMVSDPAQVQKDWLEIIEQSEKAYDQIDHFDEHHLAARGEVYCNRFMNDPVAACRQFLGDAVSTTLIEQKPEDEPVEIFILYLSSNIITLAMDQTDKYIVIGWNMEEIIRNKRDEDKQHDNYRGEFWKNIGDPTRYQVLSLIAHGVKRTKTIAEKLGVTSAAISYHLNQLTKAGILHLVHGERGVSREVNKDLIKSAIEELAEDLKIN